MKNWKPNYLKDKESAEYRELLPSEITSVGELFNKGMLRIKRSEGVFDKPISSESVGDGFLSRCLFVVFDEAETK